jgi:hypothetical protein
VFNGVKLLNFTLGTVVLFLSGVSKNLGTFCLAGSCLRSLMYFRLFGEGSVTSLALIPTDVLLNIVLFGLCNPQGFVPSPDLPSC